MQFFNYYSAPILAVVLLAGGMPMVILCGQTLVTKAVAWDRPEQTV